MSLFVNLIRLDQKGAISVPERHPHSPVVVPMSGKGHENERFASAGEKTKAREKPTWTLGISTEVSLIDDTCRKGVGSM